MVEDGAFIHKIDYNTLFWEILNLKGHLNRITGSTITAILLNGLILPFGGASAVKGLLLACAAGLFLLKYVKFPNPNFVWTRRKLPPTDF